MNNIKGAIFDMDGTLVDSLIFWDVLWEKLGEKYLNNKDFRPSADDDKAVRTMTTKDTVNHIHNVYNIGDDVDEVCRTSELLIRDFYANDVLLKDGVIEFLEYLHKKGVKMCVASATDIKLLKVAIEHCGIGKYFENVLSCSEIGKGKDEPDIYLKAIECLDTNIDNTWVFEDSHIAINTACKIGMKTVGVYDKNNYGHELIKSLATVYVDDGETLKKLID